MRKTLNIDGFITYENSTEKYTPEQLQIIADALCSLENELGRLSPLGAYSHEYIYRNLDECGKKIQVYMMTDGMKQTKASAAVADFKYWLEICMG